MAAAVQPNSLYNSQKTFYKTLSTSCRPRVYTGGSVFGMMLVGCFTKNSSFEQYPEIVADVNVAAAPHLRGRHGRQEEGVVPHLGLAGVDGALGHLGDTIGVRLKGEKL